MTVKITLKKRFSKNAATCFYTEHAQSVTCKTIPAHRDRQQRPQNRARLFRRAFQRQRLHGRIKRKPQNRKSAALGLIILPYR